MNYGQQELIVPVFQDREKQPCTAILNLETLKWTKLKIDGRGPEFHADTDTHLMRFLSKGFPGLETISLLKEYLRPNLKTKKLLLIKIMLI